MDRTVEQIRADEIAEIVNEARTASLPDAVFAITSYNDFSRLFGPPPIPPPIDLSILNDRFTEAAIDEAFFEANSLMSESNRCARDIFEKGLKSPEVVEWLRQRYPGFSEKCYNLVINRGCINNRS